MNMKCDSGLCLDLVVLIVVLLVGCFVSTSVAQSQCQLQNGQCTYTINLASSTSCPQTPSNANNYVGDAMKPEALRQASEVTIDQDLSTVKSDHENRIKELEMTIQRVLRNSIPEETRKQESSEVIVDNESETKPHPLNNRTPEGSGNLLLFQLQGQFNRITTSLSDRTADLVDARNKLNETTDLLLAAQKQALDSSNKLVRLETKAKVLERESNILKSKLNSKSERLAYANERLNASEHKLLETETQLYDVVRAESNVREELETLKIILNKTQTQLAVLQGNHSELTTKFKRMKRTLALREEELMECYSGKAATTDHMYLS